MQAEQSRTLEEQVEVIKRLESRLAKLPFLSEGTK
jgi:hypothetical protein